MKKLFLIMTCACLFSANAQAAETQKSVFGQESFVIAKAVKLGRQKGVYTATTEMKHGFGGGAIAPSTVRKGECESNEECPSDKKCMGYKCVDVCTQPTPKPGMTMARICNGGPCFADPENPHSFTCTDPNDPCLTKTCGSGLKCVSDGTAASAKCVECSADVDCASGTCAVNLGVCIPEDLCEGVTCSKGYACASGKCVFCPLGATGCNSSCTGTQVSDGKGGCKQPCDDVKCAMNQKCTNKNGKACCGCDTVQASVISSFTKIPTATFKTFTSNVIQKNQEAQAKLQCVLAPTAPTASVQWQTKNKFVRHPKLKMCLPSILSHASMGDFKVTDLKATGELLGKTGNIPTLVEYADTIEFLAKEDEMFLGRDIETYLKDRPIPLEHLKTTLKTRATNALNEVYDDGSNCSCSTGYSKNAICSYLATRKIDPNCSICAKCIISSGSN